MAITFTAKRKAFEGPSKSYAFLNLTMATSDTIVLSGLKEVWQVDVTNRPATTFTYTSTGAGANTIVLTLVCTGSSTGPAASVGVVNLFVRGI